MSDGGLDELFGVAEERAPVEVAERVERRRSPALRLFGEGLLLVAATIVVVAVLRAADSRAPLLLIVAGLLGLRLVVLAVWWVKAPPPPRLRARGGSGDGRGADALRDAVRRWERNLEQAHADPQVHTRYVLPVLAELTDERLRLRHGITRSGDPRRARELLGDEFFSALAEPARRALKARDLETYVQALERL